MKDRKTYFVGRTSEGNVNLFIKIENGKLSIMGDEGHHRSGQINTTLTAADIIEYTPEWNEAKFKRLLEIWDRWHLNTMKAGTPAQEKAVREYIKTTRYEYTAVCQYLKTKDLYIDNGYKYGTSWLKEELPADVVEFINGL
jgi:hypothetical protein